MKVRIKINDTVRIIAGKDKGKQGKVTQVLRPDGMLVVDGINKMFKYVRPQKRGDKGQRIEFWGPLSAAKVMLICPKCGKPARLGIMTVGDAKVRQCRKCKLAIE